MLALPSTPTTNRRSGNRELKLRKPGVFVNVATLKSDFAVSDVEKATTAQCELPAVGRMVAQLAQKCAAATPFEDGPFAVLEQVFGMCEIIGKSLKKGDKVR